MAYDNITFEWNDPLGLVTIDRPERSNAVDYETGQELVDALERIDDNDDLSVGILAGTGDVFCGGADLKEIDLIANIWREHSTSMNKAARTVERDVKNVHEQLTASNHSA